MTAPPPLPERREAWLARGRIVLQLALAAQLLLGITVQVRRSYRHLELARGLLRETAADARRRTLGIAYAAGLERVERAIPPDGEYLLLDLDRTGTCILLQGDLAPRHARIIGDIDEVRRRWRRQGPRRTPERTVVFTGMSAAPRMESTAALLAGAAPP